MAQQQITLLGCGKMGSAMLEGWLADTNLDANFTIIEPHQTHLGWLQGQKTVRLYADCAAAIADGAPVSTMIVLAVKPQMMDDAIADLGVMKHADCAYLSIAAGISTDWLKQRLGDAAIVIRAMPNTPAAIGKGITVLYADAPNQAPNQVRDLASQLLAAVGQVVHVQDEALMDGVTALSGSGPAYVFLLVEAMTEAGIKAGLPDDLATELAKATVCGAGALMAAVDTAPAILRENVTSKGGTTAAALAVLMADDGLASLMIKAVAAAKGRSIELGE
ncbi:pyrroline-5-carboxylate reductase [Candidatus Puniceispirillum sp.]|nr:pyrroline-5-carboxylate reductase [Candidatus Puniceispirillum sp.]